jgi:formylglycine-generating enzyme required for sulfatase activity
VDPPATPAPPPTAAAPGAWPEKVAAFLEGWATAVGDAKDDASGFPKRVRRGKDGMEMVLVPGGAFQQGAVPTDSRALPEEKPRRVVTLSKAYYVDEHEVTVAMWKTYAAATGAAVPPLQEGATEAFPAHGVSWDAAKAYVAWAGVSLPTEAQWERAARGGQDDAIFPWGADDDVKQRNGALDVDGFAGLAPVKSFPANPYGLFDVAGNVEEWCLDVYDEKAYEAGAATDPAGPSEATPTRVLRGGCAQSLRPALRCSSRGLGSHDIDPVNAGLRAVKPLP